jgi:hypothetical protein
MEKATRFKFAHDFKAKVAMEAIDSLQHADESFKLNLIKIRHN